MQGNLLSDNDLDKLRITFKKLGIEYEEVQVIPFLHTSPKHTVDDNAINIYYGSTTLMSNILNEQVDTPGIFFDPIEFSMENFANKWGRKNMLSDNPRFMTFKEFSNSKRPIDEQWFIRPDDDSKAFAGDVLRFGDIQSWYNNLLKDDIIGLGPDTKIMVNEAYSIKKEWRNQVVNGKVVASSRYRENHELSKSGTDIPDSMIKFIEDMCKIYTPHDVFTMDIALTNEGYSIIECNCSNSSGFYEMNIEDYVRSLTDYVSKLSVQQSA